MTSAPPTSRLFIERLHNLYLTPGEQSAAENLRDRLERSIHAELPSALARILEPVLKSEDRSIWFVRRLTLDFALNAEIDRGRVASVWAEQIAGELIDAMSGLNDGGDAIRFCDRTAYLAQFLLDVVDGVAWDKWYYESFAGLRALSVTAALRTAILDDPAMGLRALDSLAEKAFSIARALCPADAARVLSGLSAGPSLGERAECVSAVALAAARTLYVAADDEQRHALVLFLASRENEPVLDRGMLAEASRAIARLCRCVAEGSLAVGQLRAGADLTAIYRALGPDYAAALAPLIAPGSTLLNALFSPREDPATAFTHFGGMFLLLPLIDELPIVDGSIGWPNADESDGGIAAATLIRFLILVKCLGGQRAFGASSDPLVRNSMDIPPELDWRSISKWSGRVQPRHLDQFLDALLAGRLETGVATGPPFDFARARRPGAPELFEVDPGRGIWIRRAILSDRAEVLRDATQDLDYLSLPRALGVRRAVDIALSIAAQGILRCFAWKLPGFSQSSLRYLATNFLSCTAAVEQQTERTVVRIGRTPLNLILGMTGLNRCAYGVSWTQLPYALFPEG